MVLSRDAPILHRPGTELDPVSETTNTTDTRGSIPMMPVVYWLSVLSAACLAVLSVLSVAQNENRIAPCMTRARREAVGLAEARVDLFARGVELRVRVQRRPVHLVEDVVGFPAELNPLARRQAGSS